MVVAIADNATGMLTDVNFLRVGLLVFAELLFDVFMEAALMEGVIVRALFAAVENV